jgi:hypothetical protein
MNHHDTTDTTSKAIAASGREALSGVVSVVSWW